MNWVKIRNKEWRNSGLFRQPSFMQWSSHSPDACNRRDQWAWCHDRRPQIGSPACLALHLAEVTERRDSYSVSVTAITQSSASIRNMWWSHWLCGYTICDLQISLSVLEFDNWQADLALESFIGIVQLVTILVKIGHKIKKKTIYLIRRGRVSSVTRMWLSKYSSGRKIFRRNIVKNNEAHKFSS
jgi:hypothetical protein